MVLRHSFEQSSEIDLMLGKSFLLSAPDESHEDETRMLFAGTPTFCEALAADAHTKSVKSLRCFNPKLPAVCVKKLLEVHMRDRECVADRRDAFG
jgi:hypothetical protein